MKKSIFFILFFIGINLSAQTSLRYDWAEIESPADQAIKILFGKSLEDIWFSQSDGKLFHLKNGEWKIFEPPVNKSFTRIIWGAQNENQIYLAAMDSLWQAHFFHFINSKWQEFDYIHKVPIQMLLIIDQFNIYALGNFGTVLKLENNKWRQLQTPFKTHVNYAVPISANNIYLLTNSEGLFHFNGKDFSHIEFDNKLKINSLSSTYGRIFLNDISLKKYELINNKAVPISAKDIPKENYLSENGILYTINNRSKNQSDRIEVPPIYKPYSKLEENDGSIIFTTLDGKILIASPTTKIFFRDLAKPYGIEGPEEIASFSLSTGDLNNDNTSDLILFQQYYKPSLKIYSNNQQGPFVDKSNLVQKLDGLRTFTHRLFDFNSDGKTDIVYQYFDSTGSHLKLLRNSDKSFDEFTTIDLPKNWHNRGPDNFTPVDIDKDGDIDICLTYYYGRNDSAGYNLFLINNWWGTSWSIDSTYKSVTRGWNRQSIFADFNNDDLLDWFIINKWRKSKLLINNGERFVDESETRLQPNELSEDYSAAAIDFDNDADLDLFVSSDQNIIQIYENNGQGFFTDITKKLKIDMSGVSHRTGFKTALNFADFNNDGYCDFVISLSAMKSAAHIFISVSAKSFIECTDKFRLKSDNSLNNLVGDFDNDGDMDIYHAKFGKNNFWSNNLNDSNFIKFNIQGVSSNSNALGAKIWLYTNVGHKKVLAGYKQIGSYEFGNKTQSELIAHFGVQRGNNYLAKIKFYGGREIFLKNLTPGNLINVKEYESSAAFLFLLPGKIFGIITNHEVQSYFLVLILSVLITLAGIKFGVAKFRWDFKLTSLITSINLSIVWIIIFLTVSSQNIYLKYLFPIVSVFAAISIPILVFTISKKQLSGAISKEKLEDELLQLLITFSHGEWALRNMNSLQLFFQNFSKSNLSSQKYVDQILNRINTFVELTQINLSRIIELCDVLKLDTAKTFELKTNLNKTILFLKQICDVKILNNTDEFMFNDSANSINKIKTILSELRHNVYNNFSSNPKEVITAIIKIFESKARSKQIKLLFTNLLTENNFVLIRNNELADILDNLITNAIRAIENSPFKEIEITLKQTVPKIHIEISDSGIGIDKLDWTDIFERGYSTSNSTGEGLYSVKKTLEKYGGRIYVKSSRLDHGTTFTIELLEGSNNEAATLNN